MSNLLGSYTNDKGRTVKYVVFGDPKAKYPFQLYTQQCLRLAAFLSRHGEGAKLVLQGFVDGKRVQATGLFGYGKYEDHELIVLKADREDKRPFQFGAGKAKLILAALQGYSMADILATLAEVVGDATVTDKPAARKGKGKGRGQGGGKGKMMADPEAGEVTAYELEEEVVSIPEGWDSVGGGGEIAPPIKPPVDEEIQAKIQAIQAHFGAIARLQADIRALQASKVGMLAVA